MGGVGVTYARVADLTVASGEIRWPTIRALVFADGRVAGETEIPGVYAYGDEEYLTPEGKLAYHFSLLSGDGE